MSFSATVLRAGSWEAELETSPACCLGEVGSFASQWDLIRPLASWQQDRKAWIFARLVTYGVRRGVWHSESTLYLPPLSLDSLLQSPLAQASSALAPILSPLGLPVVRQWAALGWQCHNHSSEWAHQRPTACVSKLLLSITAPRPVLTKGNKDVKYISIKILNRVSLTLHFYIKNCHHLYLYITAIFSMSQAFPASLWAFPATGTAASLTEASAQQCTHLISSCGSLQFVMTSLIPQPCFPSCSTQSNCSQQPCLSSCLSSPFLRGSSRDISFLWPVLFPSAIRGMAVFCHQDLWEVEGKGSCKTLSPAPGRRRTLRNIK